MLYRCGHMRDHRIGRIQNRLHAAVILLQLEHGRGGKRLGKIEDVVHRGGAERIDALGIIADDREPVPFGQSRWRIAACSALVS